MTDSVTAEGANVTIQSLEAALLQDMKAFSLKEWNCMTASFKINRGVIERKRWEERRERRRRDEERKEKKERKGKERKGNIHASW